MDDRSLFLAAQLVVRRNLTEQVAAATVLWRPETRELVLHYYCDAPYGEDEEEECELSMTELIAEFSDILLAQTHCGPMPLPALDAGVVQVFHR
jgi:hypothetical protein